MASWQESETAPQDDRKRRKIIRLVAGTFLGPLLSVRCGIGAGLTGVYHRRDAFCFKVGETEVRVTTTSALTPKLWGYREWDGHRWAGMISKPPWFGGGIVLFQLLGFHAITDDVKQCVNSTVSWRAQRPSVCGGLIPCHVCKGHL